MADTQLASKDLPVVETGKITTYLIDSKGWNNTGFIISPGEAIEIVYQYGEWKTNPYWGPVGAEGGNYIAGPTYMLPGFNEGGLVGKVGDSACFAVGRRVIVPRGCEGLLFLTANDEPNGPGAGYADNHGSVTVSIRKI